MRRALGWSALTIALLLFPLRAFAVAPATHFILTAAPASMQSFTTQSFTVTALDVGNAVDTTYSGAVHFTSADPGVVFTSNDITLVNGTATVNFTLKTAGSWTITATEVGNASITGTSSAITVTAGPLVRVKVDAPGTAAPAVAFNFTATAQDLFGNTIPTYAGTVHFSSTDGSATVPADSTLVNGTKTFSATLVSIGAMFLGAQDTGDPTTHDEQQIDVAQLGQTITFGVLSSVTYGVAPFTVSATADSGLSVSFISTTTTFCTVATVAAVTTVTILRRGTCTIRASQAGNTTYSAAPVVNRSFLVNPAALTITALGASKTYGQLQSFAGTEFTSSALQYSDAITSVTLTSTGGAATAAAGAYNIVPSAPVGILATNYTITFANGTLTVNKKALTVTANNASKVEEDPNPPFSATMTGFANGETASVISGSPDLSTTATAASLPGTYPISVAVGTLAAANYSFTFVSGTLTVANGNLAPVLSAIAPSEILTGSPNTTITLSGWSFIPSSSVRIGATTISSAQVNPNIVTAVVPASMLTVDGVLNVTVFNPSPGGGTSEIRQLRVVNPGPVITSVAPAYFLVTGQATTLVLRGSSFVAASTVQVNGQTRASTFVSGSQFNVTLSASDVAAKGTLSVVLSNPLPGGGSASINVAVLNPSEVKGIPIVPGITMLETTGTASTQSTGWAGVRPADAGLSTPAYFARWNRSQDGIVTSEGAVAASTPFTSGRAYVLVDNASGSAVNTGIAIANPNASPVSVSYFFTDANGNSFGNGSLTIPANGHLGKFITEAPFNMPVGTEGTISFSASLPVSVVVLRGVTNTNRVFLMTAMPVVDVTSSTSAAVTIPHFTDGAGWSTTLLLVNPTDTPLSGQFQFISQSSGQPLTLTLNGTSGSTFNYVLPARSERRYGTSGTPSAMTAGSIRIVPGLFTYRAPSAFAVFAQRSGGMTIAEAGMAAVPPRASMQTYVESVGDFAHGARGSAESGIAIANTGTSTVTVNLEFVRINSATSSVQASLAIPAGGQVSKFLKQIQGFETLPSPLQGILRVSVVGGAENLVMMPLRGHYNERGDFLLSTTPVIPDSASPDAELIVPHIVDSDGWTTTFVFANPLPDTISVYLRTFSPAGQALPLSYK